MNTYGSETLIKIVGEYILHFCVLLLRLKVNPKFYRPTEVEQLLGDPTKAKTKLGWTPKVRHFKTIFS